MLCGTCMDYAKKSTRGDHVRYKGAWVENIVSGWDNAPKKLKKHDRSDRHSNAKIDKEAKEQTLLLVLWWRLQ